MNVRTSSSRSPLGNLICGALLWHQLTHDDKSSSVFCFLLFLFCCLDLLNVLSRNASASGLFALAGELKLPTYLLQASRSGASQRNFFQALPISFTSFSTVLLHDPIGLPRFLFPSGSHLSTVRCNMRHIPDNGCLR